MAGSIHGATYNRGEWAELYVFLKLLGEGRLYAADEMLRKNPNSFLEVLKVIRQEVEGVETEYSTSSDGLTVEVSVDGMPVVEVSAPRFLKNARALFDYLSDPALEGPTVPAPGHVCDFAELIRVTKPKSKSVKAYAGDFGGKSDIVVKVRDGKTSLVSVMGFSIKSSFASAPTLFNAGTKSAVLFRVRGATGRDAERFNSLLTPAGKRDWKACARYLRAGGFRLELLDTRDGVFAENLLVVRDRMLELLAECLVQRFVLDTSVTGVPAVVSAVAARNPLGYPASRAADLYEKAFKDFLFASFTGLTAAKRWDGDEQVNGGYIVVKDDGDALCYHASDLGAFKGYLYRNTFFEYVSCRKFDWSFMEPDGSGGYVLPINFSIRFCDKLNA